MYQLLSYFSYKNQETANRAFISTGLLKLALSYAQWLTESQHNNIKAENATAQRNGRQPQKRETRKKKPKQS